MTDEVRVKRISASQVNLYTQCARRYAFVYRLGRKEPFGKAAQAGTETHAVLEHQGPWDATWEGYETGKMAALLQAATPDNITAREERFETELDGVPVVGVIDAQADEGRLLIDYKTTSQTRYVKSVATLTDDPQRLMYVEAKQQAEQTLWLYGTWKDMCVTPRTFTVDRTKDRERFKLHVLKPAEEMLAIPDDVDPLSLKPNTKACGLYPPTGCLFRDQCFPANKLSPVTTTTKQGSAQMTSLIERLRAKAAAAGAPELPAAAPPKDSIATKIAYPVPSAVEPEGAEDAAARQQFETVFKPVTLPPPGPEAAEPVETPKKRGRPKKEAEPVQVPGPQPEPEAGSPTVSVPTTSTTRKLIKNLYVDCIPLTRPFTNASVFIAAAAETVQSDLQVPHYGLVDFSRGGPALAAQLRMDLSGTYIEDLVLETKSNSGRAVMDVLIAVSENIVKGVF